MVIDLHSHTLASDGTQRPAELVAEAADRGIAVLGLTDHDSTAGWHEAAAAAVERGVVLVPGIEVSCRHEGISIHLLGYLHDPAHPALRAALETARVSRESRARRIVEALGRDMPLSVADVDRFVTPGATVGRPHIADAMVAKGLVPDRDTAFRDYLYSGSPYYARYQAVDVMDAVRLVRSAGGVAVMAHPFAASRGRVVDDDVIAEMADHGLAGLEAFHPDHDDSQTRHTLDLARGLGLFVTGSSDYHGAGKTTRLGQHQTAPDVLAEIESRGHGSDVVRP